MAHASPRYGLGIARQLSVPVLLSSWQVQEDRNPTAAGKVCSTGMATERIGDQADNMQPQTQVHRVALPGCAQ